jgi:Second Messenger Oligonucleotide or Dinucleotide Synthetase domain
MPRTVDEGFRDFLARLTASSAESAAASTHRASIEARLKNDFGLKRFFRTGSFGNGTSISGYSDVDYFASLPNDQLTRSSNYTLTKVRNALDARFPYSGVRVNCPAVEVPVGTVPSETTEVVPAKFARKTDEGYYVYDIPDCSDGWKVSSPDAHNAYVREQDERLGRKVKPLVRFIKAWKYFRQVPISSFYLELRVAKYAAGESSIVYSIDVKRVLRMLYDNNLAAIQDPMGISGYIYPCTSDVKLEDARSKLATAVGRAESALAAEQASKIDDAFYWWRLLYNDQFPSYYY